MKFLHVNHMMIKLCIRILKCYLPALVRMVTTRMLRLSETHKSVIQVGVHINKGSKVLMGEH